MSENLSHLLQELAALEKEFADSLPEATSLQDIDKLKNEFLGRKGKLQTFFALLGRVEAEERPLLGAELNRLKEKLQAQCDAGAHSFQRRPKAISTI